MAKVIKISSLLSIILTVFFSILFYNFNNNVCYTLAITFGTTAYHFTMRLIVGYSVDFVLKNKVNYNRRWFNVSKFEMKIYKKLNVKKWKDKMPTYNPELFDISKHSWEEILMTMCQSEIVHEIIFILSFIPIIAIIWFKEPWAFIITSIMSALFDLMYVIMQRYNRNRILRLKSKL